MTVHWIDCEQRSSEWRKARLGIPTASQMDRIITPTGKPSSAQGKYLSELLSEWATGQEKEFRGNHHVRRGNELEPMARAWLEFQTGERVEPCGFAKLVFQNPSGDLRGGVCLGASPDAVVALPGDPKTQSLIDRLTATPDADISELKCPSAAVHCYYLSNGGLPREHTAQVQAQLFVTGAERCEFLSLCPDVVGAEAHHVTVEPDATIQEAIANELPMFCAKLARAKDRLMDIGVQPWS